MSPDAWTPVAALAMALLGALTGWFVPALIARIPEPPPEEPAAAEAGQVGPDGQAGPTGEGAHPVTGSVSSPVAEEDPKEPYADIARLPGLSWRCALAGAVVGGLVGGQVGWSPALLFLAYLVPVGTALAVVDWRTRLLPTKIIAPSYAVVGVLVLLASALTGDGGAAVRAALGWLVAGGTFFVLWFVYPRGMGYGDVRLSGVLGLALGWLGWGELLTGVYAGFLIGGLGGLLLSRLRLVDRKAYPFGPFMLIGAVVGILLGPSVAAWYV